MRKPGFPGSLRQIHPNGKGRYYNAKPEPRKPKPRLKTGKITLEALLPREKHIQIGFFTASTGTNSKRNPN
jgi:hypothetical protein